MMCKHGTCMHVCTSCFSWHGRLYEHDLGHGESSNSPPGFRIAYVGLGLCTIFEVTVRIRVRLPWQPAPCSPHPLQASVLHTWAQRRICFEVAVRFPLPSTSAVCPSFRIAYVGSEVHVLTLLRWRCVFRVPPPLRRWCMSPLARSRRIAYVGSGRGVVHVCGVGPNRATSAARSMSQAEATALSGSAARELLLRSPPAPGH